MDRQAAKDWGCVTILAGLLVAFGFCLGLYAGAK